MKIFNRVEAGIAFAGLLAIAIVGYSLYLMSETLKQSIPLIQASDDMKVKVSFAHLWFEEAIEGDTTILLHAQVFENIDGATALVHQQLAQIREINSTLYDRTQGGLNMLLKELDAWKQQTHVRWDDRANSTSGTYSDQVYDDSFLKILQLCDENRRNIDVLLMERQQTLNRLHILFMIFLASVFTGLLTLSVRYRGAMQEKNLDLMKLSQAVEQTDDIVTITSKQGVIEYVNPAFEKLTGFSRREAVGQKSSILKSGKHDREFYRQLWETIIKGEVFRAEIINKKKNGDLFYEEKTISPIRDSAGNIVHYVSTAKDITQRKSMEKELMHSRAMKMLGQIASGVAHEVRNPLNAILAITETMFRDFKDQTQYDEYLEHIRKQVNRLSALMRDLLDIGKPIPPSTMQATPLQQLCASSIDLYKQYEAASNHPVRYVEPETKIDLNIYGNRGKLQQVFLNLLENAAQHSPPGSEIRVVIREPGKDRVKVCIQDQGSGIPPDQMDQIFEPFFTTRKSGTGLGMSIVKHIVENHGGSILVRNNDAAPGCCIEVNLPFVKQTT